MYIPFKQYLKKSFPNAFERARSIKDQFVIEFNTLRQVGIIRLLKQLLPNEKRWKIELPIQRINRVRIDFPSLECIKDSYKDFKEGGHTFYFSPGIVQNSILNKIFDYMPCDAGIKVIKRKGAINTPFAALDKTCKTHSLMSPSHKDLILVHNIFYSLKIGPRLYDVIEIEFANGDVHIAYILEHIEGDPCSLQSECEIFINQIKDLENSNLIKLVNWNGYKDMDFLCPSCNGNLIFDNKSRSLKYVDLQNFALENYYQYLKSIAIDSSKYSHFGQKSYLMGGEYLYQEIPGLELGAKRSPAMRFDVFKNLLEQSGLSLKNKLVIDVGCNIGLMGAQYLKDGAAWFHGFDTPNMVPSTEKVLLSIGCTRFSTTGLNMHEDVSLTEHFPANLQNNYDRCVISYLAIRGHIGWIKELTRIPWDFMLYEGHQEEDENTSKRFITDLQRMKECHIVNAGWISDANSTPRYVAVIKSNNDS